MNQSNSNYVPRPASNGTIEHSGAEDYGFSRHQARAILDSYHTRCAEDEARNRRLDHDRLVSTALDVIIHWARTKCIIGTDGSSDRATNAYLTAASGIQSTTDALSLIDEIKRQLSPLVR